MMLARITVACAAALSSGAHGAPPSAPVPEPRQLAWHALDQYAFVHFGPNTFTGNEWGKGTEDPRLFNPPELDCRQWCRVFKDAGMKGVIVTAKHHDGFCLWPSRHSEHTVAKSPWRDGKGDVLRELSDACRESGLKFGVYLSPWDRNHPAYGTGEPYNEVFRKTLREVLTGYGPVFEVWFDGACGEGANGKKQVYDFPSFERTVRELQPDAVIFSDVGPDVRWVGNEQGFAGETNWSMLKVAGHGRGADNPPPQRSLTEGDIDGERWIPAECDVSIRPGWFWRESENDKVKTAAQLFDLYERSVGHNGSFLLNVPPDSRGLVHEVDAARLREFKAMVDATYGVDLARGAKAIVRPMSGQPGGPPQPPAAADVVVDGDPATHWLAPDAARQAMFTLEFDQPVTFDRVMLEEPIALGQRVKGFRILAWPVPDRPGAQVTDTLTEIARGTTVGDTRIVRVPVTTTKKLVVRIDDSVAAPAIKRIGVFRTPVSP